MPRPTAVALGALLTLSVGFSAYKLVLSGDPAANLFTKAQQLEAAGQAPLALRHYEIISESQPDSFYAPRALMKAAELRAAQARATNDTAAFRVAAQAYTRLASTYQSDPLATEALLRAGEIATANLKDFELGKQIYTSLLERAGGNGDTAATATLKLGRLALTQGQGEEAQSKFQEVLQKWPRLMEQGSEAQYHLGVVYETLLKKRDWASRAYEAVLTRYPTSTWATDARERLGLIVFSDTRGQRPARRVMLDYRPLPDTVSGNSTTTGALRSLLAARGVEADSASMEGWSLTPFVAGLDKAKPGRLVETDLDPLQTVLANAGLRYSVRTARDPRSGVRNIQDELDAAHQVLVYLVNGTGKRWTQVVGYDSERTELMLLDKGSRYEVVPVQTFVNHWKSPSPLGGPYSLLACTGGSDSATARPNLTPTPVPPVAAGMGPQPLPPGPPAFHWQLPALQARTIHLQTATRAAGMLSRPASGTVLYNLEALNYLAAALERLTAASLGAPVRESESMVPQPEGEPPLDPQPHATPQAPEDRGNGAVPKTPAPVASGRLLAFFGEPARNWATRRRTAATYLESAARVTGEQRLRDAAMALRASAEALETATEAIPESYVPGATPTAEEQRQLVVVARAVVRARDAERNAEASLAAARPRSGR